MPTTHTLDFEHRPVRLDLEDIRLRPGFGGHEITFESTFQAPWLPDDAPNSHEVLNIRARIEAGVGYTLRPVGQTSASFLVRRFPTPQRLFLIITDDQLLGLEATRGHDGITFLLDVTADLSHQSTGRPSSITTQLSHRVSASRWLEVLDQAGASISITVAVTSPLSDPTAPGNTAAPTTPSAAQAGSRLREARQLLRDGNFEGVVQTCRSVLDNLRELAPPRSSNELSKTPPQQRDQEQRWSALFHDLHSLSSAASHDDTVTRGFTWTRADAQAVLAATAGLVARTTL